MSLSTVTPPVAIVATRFVPLRELALDHKNWTNPRSITGLEDEKLAELGADLKARGIQVPLNVQKVIGKNGSFVNLVLDGQRRVLAANEYLSPDTEIPVSDRTVEAIDLTPEVADALMLDMLALGAKREGLSSYELSEVASRLRDRGKTLAQIGNAIGKDESWVSKFLSARKTADPKLMIRWRKGEITDEQFKDLAAIKDPSKQVAAATEVVKAREDGDSTEARLRAKELAAQFKNEDKPKAVNGHNGVKPVVGTPPRVVRGPQAEMFDDKPATKIVVKPAVLTDILEMAEKRAPTSDYVKGIVDFAKVMTGELLLNDLNRAWHQYVERVDGKKKAAKRKPAKAKKPAKAAKPAKKAAKKKGK